MPDPTTTPTAAEQAVTLLAAELKAIADAKAAADARQAAFTDAISKLGGLVTPAPAPKPTIPARLGSLWSSLPHVNLLWVAVLVLGLFIVGERIPAFASGLHWPSIFKPRPVTAPLHATLVFDVNAVTQADAAIRTSPTIEAALKAMNCAWRGFDLHDPLAVKLGFAAKATPGGPAVLVIQAEGTVAPIYVGPCPPSEAAIVALVTKIRTGG